MEKEEKLLDKIVRVYREAKARNPYLKGDRKAIESLVMPYRDDAVARFFQSLTSSIATPAKKYIEGGSPSSKDVIEGAFAKEKTDWVDVVKTRYPNLNKTAQKLYGEALNMILDPANLLPGMGMMGEIKNVYHGSPYLFEKFNLSKAGTGEGAAAFGHGTYFTEDPGIAEVYAKSLSEKRPPSIGWKIGTKIVTDSDSIEFSGVLNQLANGVSRQDIISKYLDKISILQNPKSGVIPEEAKRAVEWYKRAVSYTKTIHEPVEHWVDTNSGKPYVYKATIKPGQTHELISWNNPVSKSVKQKILNHYSRFTGSGALPVDSFSTNFGSTGREVYGNLVDALGSKEEASKFLKGAGIDGIEYPSGTLSGIKGSTHKNYVIFSDKDIKINKVEAR
ncbi:MAG: hypothetical protein LLF94_01130 [Chlamydiales bacterium]|nr:hypothetical protein [Chlamydiales bacterium]